MSAWHHVRSIALLPGMVTGVIPIMLVWLTGPDTFRIWPSFPATRFVLPIFGGVLICLGMALLIVTNRLFATVGQGTLAPWDPTQRLVVQGVYRHVRNPMISGVFTILLGETIAAASFPLLCWFTAFVVVNVVYIPFFEEPALVKKFGADYMAYEQNVPRWLPRLTPWRAAKP